MWDRFHLERPSSPPRSAAVPWGGREWTGALGRGPGTPASPRPRPRPGGSVRGQDALGFPLRPTRAPGAAEAQRRDRQEPDPPGPRGRPQPPPRPLRPALGRGLPARGPALAQLPQGHARRCWLLPPPSRGTNLGTGTRHGRPRREAASGRRGPDDSGRLGSPARRRARPRSLPPGRGPGAPSPGLHNSHPARARTRLNRVAQPTCCLF